MASAVNTEFPTRIGAPRARFIATICAGSFLLFLVQPMVARMALPKLGGAPSVWNSAMLVYQALLLGGYAYAHWLGRFSARQQSYIHIALFALAAIMLPIGLGNAVPPADANPYFWVPYLLLTSIGPLFFMVAAQAPLMQRWFTLSGGSDPYPLYAASNLGSFGGLIAYPLIVEPILPVAQQSLMWSIGYGVVLLLIGLCAINLPKTRVVDGVAVASGSAPSRKLVLKWILLSAVPSGLMLSTSLHLTTDIVAMPLLWVLPLGLYLLSFSVAFATDQRLAALFRQIAPIVLLIAGGSAFADTTNWPFTMAAVTLLSLFTLAVAMHASLFADRPDPNYLTQFYLAMSVGGVIGGIFCALLAPLIFDWTYEHPILLAASGLLLTSKPIFAIGERFFGGFHTTRAKVWAGAFVLLLAMFGAGGFTTGESYIIMLGAAILILLVALIAMGNRLVYTISLVAFMLCLSGFHKLALSAQDGKMTRSFFGIYTIGTNRGVSRLLAHGTTVHGIQNLRPGKEMSPTTYYAPKSGVGLAMLAAPKLFGPKARIGVVGLGAGTLACYRQPGQAWHYYEIDPVIAEIAKDKRNFTFLSKCQPDAKIEIGDARISLAREPASAADLLVIDAFSSDSVPMHLITREAFDVYRRQIGNNGLLLVHITNRYLDLRPVIAAAAATGWIAVERQYFPNAEEQEQLYTPSLWIALSPNRSVIQQLSANAPSGTWAPLIGRPGFSVWTDDHASILSILKLNSGH
jgi:hypothetical protein